MTSRTSSSVSCRRAAGPSRSVHTGWWSSPPAAEVSDPTAFRDEEIGPDVLREREVRGVVAVKVADLAPPDLEGEFAAAAGPGLDPPPRRDLGGDLLAGCHGCMIRSGRSRSPSAIGPRTTRSS